MENIHGTIAMVQLDPHGLLQPRIGVISSIGDHSAELKFADRRNESFDSSEIRVLIDRQSLYRWLLSSASNIPVNDFKILFQVNMLQDRGDLSSLLNAYQLLKSSPGAALHVTEPLSDLLLRHSEKLQSSFSPSR